MSWLCAIILLFWIVMAFQGLRRGLIRSAVAMLFSILVIVVVSVVSPYVNDFLRDHTKIYEIVEEQCSDTINSKIKTEEGTLTTGEQASLIEKLPIPDSIKEDIGENNNNIIYQLLDVTSFTDYLTEYFASGIVAGIAYLLSTLIAFILIGIVTHVLDLFARLPVIGGLNRIGGLIFGVAQGLIGIWIFFVIVSVLGGTDIGQILMKEISGDRILSLLYDNNVLMKIIMKIITKS